jgi:hypothetical protein
VVFLAPLACLDDDLARAIGVESTALPTNPKNGVPR